jgi:hypothetical protein
MNTPVIYSGEAAVDVPEPSHYEGGAASASGRLT